jgi:hypothetical protein
MIVAASSPEDAVIRGVHYIDQCTIDMDSPVEIKSALDLPKGWSLSDEPVNSTGSDFEFILNEK